jgi:hypothetical protein
MYWPLRGQVKQLPLWGFAVLALPMVLDGGSHAVSDFAGIGVGFRYHNDWLAALTNHVFPAAYYPGDAVGSFNAWMRLLTGLLFSLGAVWLGFPYLEKELGASGVEA